MERRIVKFENGIVTFEDVTQSFVSKEAVEKKEIELKEKKENALNALDEVAQEEKELADAKLIIAEAEEKFKKEVEVQESIEDIIAEEATEEKEVKDNTFQGGY